MVLRLPVFRQLRTRLAVLYAGMFAVAMITVAGLLYAVVQHNAEVQVRSELVANGTVFDRLWQQRTAQLRGAAALLSRDFGFRAAVATHDRGTVESALANLRSRLGLKSAFIVGVDGEVIGVESPAVARQAAALAYQLDGDTTAGIVSLGGEAREAVAAPIEAPALIGWVVFTNTLDRTEMATLERLAAIPLSAAVYQRSANGRWLPTDRAGPRSDPRLDRLIDDGIRAGEPLQMNTADGTAIALAKRLPTMPGAPPTVLLLRYPVALALRLYRPLEFAIAIVGILSVLGVVIATFRLARTITQPISMLDAAAGRLADGDVAKVPVESQDELGRLAETFNRMSADIAERERRITHLAFHDLLTGLPNRGLFAEHLDHELALVARNGGGLAILCLDLDDFKSVNDTLGHPIGDELLRRIANRLRDEGGGRFVARLGGDEFVIVHRFAEGEGGIDELARRTLSAIGAPTRIEDHDVDPAASIGIAVAPHDGTDAETLLRNADLALYRAKEAGRGTWRFFEESMNERAQLRRAIETDLRQALNRGELEVHYQPLLDLQKDRIGSFEALARWRHPTRGLVPPIDFIPVAEATGLIVPIGAWVLQEACRQAARWPEYVRVAVNVSSVQFAQPGLAQTVLHALQNARLSPDRLELEITESIFLESSEATLAMLHSLKSLGIRIALDDFGTGYSSLSYLQSFPFDKIKIDRSFVTPLLTKPSTGAIIRAIVDLARALGMETTAEGVEESSQLAQLQAHGCTSIQGYLISRPLPAKNATVLLNSRAAGHYGVIG